MLCKRPNTVYLIKMLKHQAQKGFGAKKCVLCILHLTSTQDVLQASQFLRLVHNILKYFFEYIPCLHYVFHARYSTPSVFLNGQLKP